MTASSCYVGGGPGYFADAFAAYEPGEAQKKALAWLPEAMRFVSIDPDATENDRM